MNNAKNKEYEINDVIVKLKLSETHNNLMELENILYKLIEENNKLNEENLLLKKEIHKYKDKINNTYNPNRKWCVYKHTNKINGKVYIGITGESILNQRWDNGNGYKDNKLFFSDIQEYGWIEGFYHIVIEDNLTKQEAEDLEKKLIKKYNSQNKDYGYNLAIGGVCCSTNAVKVCQYDLNGNFIKEYSSIAEATRINKGVYDSSIRACCRGKRSSAGGYIWKFTNEETKIKKGKINKDKEIFQYSLDGKFIRSYKNAVEASSHVNISSVLIHRACQNLTGSSGNFQWFYEYKGDTIESSKFYNNMYRHKTSVDMFDKNMKFIKHYESIKDATQDLRDNFNVKNAQDRNLYNNLKGQTKTAYGFIFKYA